ncbi:MAG: hypothetical protein OXH50_13040 [Gemmatimonadetes bacterium]|nr:hypothetical protein [Gemmatimonadota bacterium]
MRGTLTVMPTTKLPRTVIAAMGSRDVDAERFITVIGCGASGSGSQRSHHAVNGLFFVPDLPTNGPQTMRVNLPKGGISK